MSYEVFKGGSSGVSGGGVVSGVGVVGKIPQHWPDVARRIHHNALSWFDAIHTEYTHRIPCPIDDFQTLVIIDRSNNQCSVTKYEYDGPLPETHGSVRWTWTKSTSLVDSLAGISYTNISGTTYMLAFMQSRDASYNYTTRMIVVNYETGAEVSVITIGGTAPTMSWSFLHPLVVRVNVGSTTRNIDLTNPAAPAVSGVIAFGDQKKESNQWNVISPYPVSSSLSVFLAQSQQDATSASRVYFRLYVGGIMSEHHATAEAQYLPLGLPRLARALNNKAVMYDLTPDYVWAAWSSPFASGSSNHYSKPNELTTELYLKEDVVAWAGNGLYGVSVFPDIPGSPGS